MVTETPVERPRLGRLWLAALLALPLATATPTRGLETDQYIAWEAELRDSSAALNSFVNRELASTLERMHRAAKADTSCDSLPPRLLRSLFRTTSIPSKLRRFLSDAPGLDRYPGPEVGYWRYLGDSLFRAPAFPFILPMARTIRVGDVHTGTDKIGHLFGFGRRYYKRYRAAIAGGLTEEEALRRVVTWGVQIERFLAGGILDGVFSHADVEANYQGLRLALDLCGGDRPYLRRGPTGWHLARPIDLATYVTPYFDESYHNSHFSDQRWRSIQVILEGYCPTYRSAPIVERRERYARVAQPSASMRIVETLFAARANNRQRRHSIDAVCRREASLLTAG